MSLRSTPLRPTTARRLRAPAVGLAAALLLVGCGSGQRAEVYQERTVADATNESVGSIAVRNLAVQAPAQGQVLRSGSNAPMVVTFVNEPTEDDVLTSVTTPAASSVRILGPTSTLPVPRLGSAPTDYSLQLVGLTRDLPSGSYIQLTLDFQRNGSKTVLVPIQTTPDGAPRPTSQYEVPDTDSAGSPLGDNPVAPE